MAVANEASQPNFSFSPSPYGPSTAHDALPASICGSYQFGSPAGSAGGVLSRLTAAGPPRCIAANPELDPLHALRIEEADPGPAAQQLEYLRARHPSLFLPVDTLTKLVQDEAAGEPWYGSRRGNALSSSVNDNGVVLCHPHGALCDRIRLTSVQHQSPADSTQQLSCANMADASCDGSVRQIATSSCRNASAFLSVAARTDYTVQVWCVDMEEPQVQLSPVARRMFDVALLDSALDNNGLVVALTQDGCLHSASTVDDHSACSRAWSVVAPQIQNEHANATWEFVTRAPQPGTFLTAGPRSFGLFDIRAKRIEELMKIDAARATTTHDPWAAPTSALCQHQDPNSAQLFARTTTTCTEVYDHRYLAQPLARWRLYDGVTGAHDMLHFAHHISDDSQQQPYLLSGSTRSGRVMGYSYTATSPSAVLDAPYRMPDLSMLSATIQRGSCRSGAGYVMPPRGQLCGLSATQGLHWLYELDNCGEVYAVPLCSEYVERLSSRNASAVAGHARPSVWVQNVDVRPVVDSRAIVRLLMESGESASGAEQCSSLGALARLNAIVASCSTTALDAKESSTDTSAAHLELLRLPRNLGVLQHSRKRPREYTATQPRPEAWSCRVCSRQSTDPYWSSLRNHLSFPSTHSDAPSRLCSSCAAAVEDAMRDELTRRAKQSVARKASKSRERRIGSCTWVPQGDRPQEVPRGIRDSVLAYIALSPRTLCELTAWLRLHMSVEESVVARFVKNDLGALVHCTHIADRLSEATSEDLTGHRTVYSLNPDHAEASDRASTRGDLEVSTGQSSKKSSIAAYKALWDSS